MGATTMALEERLRTRLENQEEAAVADEGGVWDADRGEAEEIFVSEFSIVAPLSVSVEN